MTILTKLYMTNWTVVTDANNPPYISYSGENNTEELDIIPFPKLDSAEHYSMDFYWEEETTAARTESTIEFSVANESVADVTLPTLHVLLTAKQTGDAGVIHCQIVAYNGNGENVTIVKKSSDFLLKIGESVSSEEFSTAVTAQNYLDQTKEKAESAAQSAEAAQTNAETATKAADSSSSSANDALSYANLSKSYAVGSDADKGESLRENDTTDNAKYYYEQIKDAYERTKNAETKLYNDLQELHDTTVQAAQDTDVLQKNALGYANLSKSYAVGSSEGEALRGEGIDDTKDNAKYYYEQTRTALNTSVTYYTQTYAAGATEDPYNTEKPITTGTRVVLYAKKMDDTDAAQQAIPQSEFQIAATAQDVQAIKANTEAININSKKLNSLIGDDTNKSVRTIANEELAAQLIPSEAKESLDTLKEIAAQIQSHPDEAAAMNTQIQELRNVLATFMAADENGNITQDAVKNYIDTKTNGRLTSIDIKDVGQTEGYTLILDGSGEYKES